MQILIITQDENLYLPESFATVCDQLGSDIVCIVSCPAMSTHGGAIKGFWKHFRLFGFKGTFTMGFRVIKAKLKSNLRPPDSSGPFYSIKQVADSFGIHYHYVEKLAGQNFQNLLDKYSPELLISISCPQVISKKIRVRISNGCINVHGAPLPKYRGLMPAFWVLRNGETKTATTVHDLEAKLDDGDILVQRQIEITREDTWDSLVRKTKSAGAKALVEAVKQIKAGTVERKPNREEEATYFSFPNAEDRKIFLNKGRKYF